MRKVAVLATVLLTACSTMGDRPVEGWPELQIVEHYVPAVEMRERCSRYVAFGMLPEACSEFDLRGRRCHIWFSADPAPAAFIRKHERLHCQGYDHAGSDGMRKLLQAYQAQEAASAAAGAGASR